MRRPRDAAAGEDRLGDDDVFMRAMTATACLVAGFVWWRNCDGDGMGLGCLRLAGGQLLVPGDGEYFPELGLIASDDALV
ncbi:hypothetical protein Dimus_006386 [Dionaea muscipula]